MDADAEVDSESDFESFLASTSVSNAITRFKHEDIKLRRRQDLNIDSRGSCGSVGSVSWQALGSSFNDSDEPLVAFSTRSDKEVRVCRVMENGRSSSVEYSLKVQKWLSPNVIKFLSPTELLITSSIKNSSRVLLYNVEAQKPNFFSSIGGKELTQTRYVANNEKSGLFSVSYDGASLVSLDKRSKGLVSENRLNNTCVGISWSKSGEYLYAGDERSNIYQFDSRMMNQCVVRTQLETTSSLSSFSMNGENLIACGSPFGTVDIVEVSSLHFTPKPVSSFDKLVTGVDRMIFHPIHSSMLVASSRHQRNALRVYECINRKTLPGWPSESEPIGRSQDLSFSDCGRFLAIGCKSGRVQLYAL